MAVKEGFPLPLGDADEKPVGRRGGVSRISETLWGP
jgi:hypothetical protein